MANIVLHEQDLINAARMMREAADEMEKTKKRADEIISNMQKNWVSANATKYLEKYKENNENFDKLIKAVGSYEDFLLNDVLVKYRNLVNRVSESMNG